MNNFIYNYRRILLLMVTGVMTTVELGAQIVERERPIEWSQLVEGGRFMDRFLPMAEGQRAGGVSIWGADSVQARFVDNGIEQSDISFWGGNILRSNDGHYHLYVCGWPESSPKGHMFWANSTVFHAVATCPQGPYRVEGTIGKGHNPEAFRLADGRVVVYVIDGYYVADSEDSRVWTYGQFDFDARDRKIIEGLSNLTFTRRQDGSFLMVCRGGGVWVSRHGLSTYYQLSDKRIYPDVNGAFEDPVLWRDSLQYHLIVNDWMGRIAYYLRSRDGLHWVTEPGEAYMPGIARHPDGETEHWFKYERPKVLQDAEGRVEQMNFAVIDTIKWEDLPNDRHSSKNICIPMNKGLLLEVLNQQPITAKTRRVEVLIRAEEGFDPQTDVDVPSLRFGAYTEVNYGRGSFATGSRLAGRDLIVTFCGRDCGITADEFAPKLIGRDRRGHLLFGYARLPYVDYQPPLLSARKPVYDEVHRTLSVVVENFGLSASEPCEVQFLSGGKPVGKVSVDALHPYGSQTVSINNVEQPNDITVCIKEL